MKNYPDLLRHIHQPPKKIYSLGDSSILGGNLIAFVGTRNFTPYGKMMTERLIEDLALCKIVIVSGLARGIDTIAHEAALRVGLKTVAVLGTGIGNIYPEENCELADRIIADGGCIVSEYPGDAPARSFSFPQRNRIIAGLSLATVVVEAPESSGALITAKRANEESRDVFAVPGDIDRPESVGCNRLIQSFGAKAVMSGMDIIRELKIQPTLKISNAGQACEDPAPAQIFDLSDGVAKILSVIPKTKPINVEQIIERSEKTVLEVNKALSMLEIYSLVVSTDSGFYLRTC